MSSRLLEQYVYLFLLFIIININKNHFINCEFTRELVVKKDFFNGIKPNEFSVYDTSEKNLKYRIDTKWFKIHGVSITAKPSNEEIATVEAKLTWLLYEANFRILDNGVWKDGTIKRKFKVFYNTYEINYDQKVITLEGDVYKWNLIWKDVNTGKVYGQIRKRAISLILPNVYELFMTDDFPEAFYLVGVAVADRFSSSSSSSSSSRKNG
ncbi:unnamed protein product [Didymodactylos carnosus]|uniref:Uncharacterized protein n=1 Tax=Didymodactylos carnosus TaxID=1234261 RepID=A0A814T041_9BILA|nr:unnamed protein product [Didymodactylos carnosus]CAF1152840.1 unnamed protein product [Didymodactylos carnosus]CAF3530070.1 unnamed protein product [Didymodactylos carnosus]CAF3916350.1 unnamed protein product [Didymodactylos carnosus]